MRIIAAFAFGVCVLATLPCDARAADDAPGCADLKLFPRLQGCLIVECSAKQHDSFDAPDIDDAPLDASIDSVTYSCPASANLQRIKRELEADMHRAGYQKVSEDASDPDSPEVTARNGPHWLRWGASSEDGGIGYWLTEAESAADKFKPAVCGAPAEVAALNQCKVVECASKSEDSVSLRSGPKQETPLTGNVQTVTLSCPSNRSAQTFQKMVDELRQSGFEILASDGAHPSAAWITGRAGKRWLELATAEEGEALSYTLTVVPSGEVLSEANSEPQPAPATPNPPAVEVAKSEPEPQTGPPPQAAPSAFHQSLLSATPSNIAINGPAPVPVFIPPKPILRAPIESTPERIQSVTGNVVIHLLIDVDENGIVTQAVLTGHISRNARKLESAAIAAMSRWRFEPARQDGRIVACVKIPVEISFRGRPWLF